MFYGVVYGVWLQHIPAGTNAIFNCLLYFHQRNKNCYDFGQTF